MPQYDVECADCGHSGIIELKIAALDAWDASATCPECQATAASFRRVIRQVPAAGSGKTGRPAPRGKMSSGERETMLHATSKRIDHGQVAAAREGAKKGDF